MVKTIGRQVAYDLSCSMQKKTAAGCMSRRITSAPLGVPCEVAWLDEWSVYPFFFPLALQEERIAFRFIKPCATATGIRPSPTSVG